MDAPTPRGAPAGSISDEACTETCTMPADAPSDLPPDLPPDESHNQPATSFAAARPSSAPSSSPTRITRITRAPSAASRQDRLDDILATARQRAEDSVQAAFTSGTSVTNHQEQHGVVRMEPLLRSRPASGSDGPQSLNSRKSARHLHYAGRAGYGTVQVADDRPAETPPLPPPPPAPESAPRRFLRLFQSYELENKGSVARDHLALERTFLAWLRTSLTFASIGIGVTQLFRLNTTTAPGSGDNNPETEERLSKLRRIGRPLGSTFLSISILVLGLGYHRFHQSQQWIMRGKFPASRGTILLVSFVALALMLTSLVIVVVIQPAMT